MVRANILPLYQQNSNNKNIWTPQGASFEKTVNSWLNKINKLYLATEGQFDLKFKN